MYMLALPLILLKQIVIKQSLFFSSFIVFIYSNSQNSGQ